MFRIEKLLNLSHERSIKKFTDRFDPLIYYERVCSNYESELFSNQNEKAH